MARFRRPGVRAIGVAETWTDHNDVWPTMFSLLGLANTYVHDGRVIVEPLFGWAVPQTLRAHRETLLRLGDVHKPVNAAFGSFAMDLLAASTKPLASGTAADDRAYATIEGGIASLTDRRDALATQIKTALNAATFGGQALNE